MIYYLKNCSIGTFDIYICKIHMYKNRGSFVRIFQAQVQNSPNIYIFFFFDETKSKFLHLDPSRFYVKTF